MLLVFTFLFFFVGSSLADHAHDHDQDHIQVGDWVVVSDWEAKQWEQDQPAKSLRQPAARWEFLKFLFLPTIVQGWLLWCKCKLCSRTEHHGPLYLWLLAHSRPHPGRHQHAEGVRGHPFGPPGSTFGGRLWCSTGTPTSFELLTKVSYFLLAGHGTDWGGAGCHQQFSTTRLFKHFTVSVILIQSLWNRN